MHKIDDPTMPPLAVLAAFRQPRCYMIDEPSPFEPIRVWRKHLRGLETLDRFSEQVQRAIEDAKAAIRQIRAWERESANYVPGMTAPDGWFPFRVP